MQLSNLKPSEARELNSDIGNHDFDEMLKQYLLKGGSSIAELDEVFATGMQLRMYANVRKAISEFDFPNTPRAIAFQGDLRKAVDVSHGHVDRNYVRQLLKYTQMDKPTEDQIFLLYTAIGKRLIESGLMDDTYRVASFNKYGVRVKSYYFDNREAVSFEPDSDFVGFCGWADPKHTAPILDGVIDWVNEVTGYDGFYKMLDDFTVSS